MIYDELRLIISLTRLALKKLYANLSIRINTHTHAYMRTYVDRPSTVFLTFPIFLLLVQIVAIYSTNI